MQKPIIATCILAAGAVMVLAAAYARTDAPQAGRHGPRGPMMPPPDVMDANQDGSVSLQEFFAAMDKMSRGRFTQMDKNADGALTQDEFVAQRQGPPPESGQGGPHPPDGDTAGPPPPPPGGRDRPAPPRFENFDADQDGKVTLREFSAASDKLNQERFNRMDANADGALSNDELANMQRPGPPRGEGRGGQRRDRPHRPQQ